MGTARQKKITFRCCESTSSISASNGMEILKSCDLPVKFVEFKHHRERQRANKQNIWIFVNNSYGCCLLCTDLYYTNNFMYVHLLLVTVSLCTVVTAIFRWLTFTSAFLYLYTDYYKCNYTKYLLNRRMAERGWFLVRLRMLMENLTLMSYIAFISTFWGY